MSSPVHALSSAAATPLLREVSPSPSPDLWAALGAQVRAFIRASGLGCDWAIDIAPGLLAPDAALATAVCGIFQEMLDNVARHAQASQVAIRISATASDITLRVRDNGRGAPPSAFERPDAWGMMGMRERARHFGGWLHIDSQLGQGTQLILSMPRYQAGAHSRLGSQASGARAYRASAD